MQWVGALGPHMTMGTTKELPEAILEPRIVNLLDGFFLTLNLFEKDIFELAYLWCAIMCNSTIWSDDINQTSFFFIELQQP